ncbi:hypothetical protein Ancab_022423 [Ancistrocladus abbreviatus]
MIVEYCNKSLPGLTQFLTPILRQTRLIQTKSLVAHLKNCSKLQDLQSIQATMIKINATQDCYFMNQFVTACSSLNHMDYAVIAIAQIDSPNIFVYNAFIRGFVKNCCPIKALEFYLEVLRADVFPTSYTFSPLIKACGMVSAVGFGGSVHCHVLKNGFQSHVFVMTALIDFYATLGRTVDSRKVFDEMPERDPFAWTTMVSVLARSGDMYSARKLFYEMPAMNAATWNTMIDGYARLGDIESAAFLFNRMPERDLISWTTMIACYSRNKQYREALALFNEMINNGLNPDEITVATVISSCAHLGALDLGKQIHFHVMQQRLFLDVYIGSALIDMYAKCGSLDRSLVIFLKLREKNLFCWNAVIAGLAVHGHGKEALAMFNRMLKGKIKPNGVTFISLLSACSHAGLVDQGRQMFLSMTHDFSISPEIEHYGCMVDLLSRAGLLMDALEVIRCMKMEPNSIIWGALLTGCKQSGYLEIAESTMRKLMVLEPENFGHYIHLVNMHAKANRWNEVARIRTTVKELGVEKQDPGSSWIEMGREIHQFVATDKSHFASNQIYSLLDKLDEHLKLAGCGYMDSLIQFVGEEKNRERESYFSLVLGNSMQGDFLVAGHTPYSYSATGEEPLSSYIVPKGSIADQLRIKLEMENSSNDRGSMSAASDDDREKEWNEFQKTKAGVQGLVDAGIVKIPKLFILPSEELPLLKASSSDSSCVQLQVPVIDLEGCRDDRRKEIVAEIRQASETWGVFQVINPGISMDVMNEMLESVRLFHEQPKELKMELYGRDPKKVLQYYSSDRRESKTALWRDTMVCNFEDTNAGLESLPLVCRKAMGAYLQHVIRLKDTLSELLSEALELDSGHLNSIACMEAPKMACQYYPACPEPDLTIGTSKHSDPYFLAILLQNGVSGLQVLNQEHWVDVPPMEGALIAFICDLLQYELWLSDMRVWDIMSTEHKIILVELVATVYLLSFPLSFGRRVSWIVPAVLRGIQDLQ